MSTLASPSLITRLTRRRRRAPRPQEAADMGTAFGMEQCLDERAQNAVPAGGANRPGWWARLWMGGPAR